MIRLHVAANAWGRGDEELGSTTATATLVTNTIAAVTKLLTDAFSASNGAVTGTAVTEITRNLGAVYDGLSVYAPAGRVSAAYRDDNKLFNRIRPLEAIIDDMKGLAAHLRGHNTLTVGAPGLRYWNDPHPEVKTELEAKRKTPDFDEIDKDIERVVMALGLRSGAPGAVQGPIDVPNIKEGMEFMGLSPTETVYLFRGGGVGGSIATKMGFTVHRDNTQYVTQRIRAYTLATDAEPAYDSLHFNVRYGWNARRASWFALQTFLKKYTDFLIYVYHLRTNGPRSRADLNKPLQSDANPGPMNLEKWLRDEYVRHERLPGASDEPEVAYPKVESKHEGLGAVIANLGAYIGIKSATTAAPAAIGEEEATWDTETPPDAVTSQAGPPDLGNDDWSTWE
jgi:hypothetical protein